MRSNNEFVHGQNTSRIFKPSQKLEMDPSQFPISTIPLNHSPYGPLKAEQIAGINKGKVAVVTGGGNGERPPDILGP